MTTPAKPTNASTSPAKKRVTSKPATQIATGTKKPTNTPAAKIATTKAIKPVKDAKKIKPAKVKMVRDSYSMPESDYVTLIDLKKKCVSASVKIKKSELIRLGIQSLAKLSDAALIKEANKLAVTAEK
jgi:hypothetical protein